MEAMKFSKDNVHCTEEQGCQSLYEIDLESIKNLDQDWAAYGEQFLRSQKDAEQPFFLYYGTRAAHFDNYPNDEYAGKSRARTSYSDVIVEIDDVFGRLMKVLEETEAVEGVDFFGKGLSEALFDTLRREVAYEKERVAKMQGEAKELDAKLTDMLARIASARSPSPIM